jgi:hypothetical protein
MADQFTPTPDEQSDIDSAVSFRDRMQQNLDTEDKILASDQAAFDPTGPEGTGGPRPTFNEPQPQDHMDDLMKTAPIFMALAAIGGSFSHQSGLTMLTSTNAMMKGIVQGDADAYGQARDKYDRELAEYKDKNRTWMDTYRAYMAADKGRADADLRARASANAAVGIADKDVRASQAEVMKRVQLTTALENADSRKDHYSKEDVQNSIRTQVQQDREKRLAEAQQKGSSTPESEELLAAMADKGVTLPQGMRSQKTLQTVLNGLLKTHPGMTAGQIAEGVKTGSIEMKVASTEASKLGTREAQILPVEKSITGQGGFLDQAEKAVNDVNFSDVKKLGELEKVKMDQISDPKLTAYVSRVMELRQEYAIVLSKGGMTTNEARAEAAKVVPDQITPKQFQEIKKAVTQGIQTSKKGVKDSINEVSGAKPNADAGPPKYAYGPDGKPKFQLINGNWVPLGK